MASISKREYVATFILASQFSWRKTRMCCSQENSRVLLKRWLCSPFWQFRILHIEKSLHILSCYFDVYNLIMQADKSILHHIHNISKYSTLIDKSLHIRCSKFSDLEFWNRLSINVGHVSITIHQNVTITRSFPFFIKTQSSCQPVFGTSRSLSIKFFEDGNKKLDGQTFCSSPKAIPARLFFCWTVLAHSLWKAKRHYYELFGIWEGLLYPS